MHRSAVGNERLDLDSAAVRIERLTKRFKSRRTVRELVSRAPARFVTALDDVSISIPRGVMYGLLGENGAGKSTLMRILATLVLPDGGKALVEGVDAVLQPRQVRRLVASATGDERSMNWRLSVRQNLELYAALHGLSRGLSAVRVGQVLEAVSLAAVERRPVGQLSSGMKQRVLIARALLANPRVLLLDEPTRSLDPVSAQSLRSFLRDEVLAKRECTVLLATHTTEEAFESCDELLILHEGRVIESGASADLVDQYAGNSYRIWVRSFSREQWSALAASGVIIAAEAAIAPGPSASSFVVQLPRSEGSLDRFLSALVLGGAAIERLEAVPLTLAVLLTRATRAWFSTT